MHVSGDEHIPLVHGLVQIGSHRYLFPGLILKPALHVHISGDVHKPFMHVFEHTGTHSLSEAFL